MCMSCWLCCPAVVRAYCDTAQTCWGNWERCCSSQPFWVEPLNRNKCWRWSSSQTTQTTLWVVHCFVNVLQCVWKENKYFVEVYLMGFPPCTVLPLCHSCHWDPVQQGADLLISALHSCSFHWYKVGITGRCTYWQHEHIIDHVV